MRKLVVTFLLLMPTALLLGQSFTIYNYSILEGIPSSEVYEVFQDKKGFLWFGTDNGVVRFDGTTFQVFHTKDGLSDPVVFGFFQDYKDRIWFRSFSGKLSYFMDGKVHRYAYNDSISLIDEPGIMKFYVNEKDEVHFTALNYHGMIDANGKTTLTLLKDPGLHYFTQDKDNLLGAAYVSLLEDVHIDGKKFAVEFSVGASLSRVYAIAKWRDKIYLSINHDIFSYDGTSLQKVKTSKHPVISLSVDREDNLWVGYMYKGVERYTDTAFESSWSPDFLKDKSVTKVHQDHEQGFWFTSLEKGIFHAPNLFIEHFPLPAGSRVKGVINGGENVVVAVQNGEVLAVNKDTKKSTLKLDFKLPVMSAFANDNNLFISTNMDIQVYDQNFHLKTTFHGLATDFSKDHSSRVWVFGASSMRIISRDLSEDRYIGKLTAQYRSIYVDDSLVFLADKTGLHIRNHSLELIDKPRAFANYKIANFLEPNDSTMLITTIGSGFMVLDKRTMNARTFNSETSFIANNIYSSVIHKEFLWLGTEKGLIKIALPDLFQDSISFAYLSKKSGLINNKIDYLLPVNNTIWAFSDNAFSIIPEDVSKFPNKKPIFYLKEIKVNDVHTDNISNRELKTRENNIQIAFGFISYSNQNIFLRYRLRDNTHWIYTTDNSLLFPSLAPASYQFRLQYSTDNVRWIDATDPLDFIISKPWWSRWYTYVIAFSILLIFSYFYFRYQQSIYRQKNHYLKIINEHQQRLIQSEIVALERERNRISKELHDRVGTNLTAIKLTVNQLLQQHRDPLAMEVEEQFQIAIQEIKEIIYGLTPPSLERYGLFTGLKNYVGKLHKTIPIEISLKTFGKDIQKNDINIIIFRIMQELITNSIKHSFAKNITIHINSFDDILNIVYEDDGIGFNYDPLQSGLGLDSIESRIHSVNGTLKFDSGKFGVSYTIDIPVIYNKEVA
jgi:signal transduction histidine kinase/ligand-binding sensor domain-containing protein